MLGEFWIRLRALMRRNRVETELDDELRFHFERQVEKFVQAGLSREQARRRARLEFGGLEQVKEECREARGGRLIDNALQDIRHGVRMLRKNPGFTAFVALTLALGIGANTAVFSMVDAVLLHRLPYPGADRLVMVWEDVRLPHYQNDENTPAPGNFAVWKKQNRVFSGMAAIGYRSWNLTGTGQPVRIEGAAFSAGIFTVLQTYPTLGRPFTVQEDLPGAARVALLGYGLWRSRFGGDPSVLGRTIQLDEENYRVIGVMPPGFHFPDPDDELYVPLALSPEALANHGSHYLRVVARLLPGVTLRQAQSDLGLIARRLAQRYPDSNSGVGVRLIGLREQVTGELQRPLLVLFGVVGLVLLMTCANVASLVFARASVRGREFAVRAALGAGRGRMLGQLLTESLLLGALGGGLGLAAAFWGMALLRWLAPANPALVTARLNTPTWLYALAVSLISGLLFGLLPAFQASSGASFAALRDARGESGSPARLRAHGPLIVFEVALGVMVLAGTGLLLRSFIRLEVLPLGFQPAHTLTMRVIVRGPRYATVAQDAAFYREVVQRLGALPGVREVGGISFLPLTFQGRTRAISIEGQAPMSSGELPFVDFRSTSPGYFAAMGIPLLAGRDFRWSDTEHSRLVAVVSETMVRELWSGGSAIGKRFKLGAVNEAVPWVTVIGIVADVRQVELTGHPRAAMYLAATQDAGTGDTLRDWVIRTSGSPTELAAAAQSAIWAIDPDLPVSRIQSMEDVRSAYLGPQRFEFGLAGLFGVLALILAAAGLYGVTAYAAARRRHEIGIRMALGASRRDVLRLVVRQGAKLTIAGIAAGLAGAAALTRLMASLLYGVSATDPLTFAGVAALLAIVALAACYIPARRAMRVDPMAALRQQ